MPVEGQEYLLTRNGRYRCLVCQGRPVYTTVKLFREHRHLKAHAGRLKEWRANVKARLMFDVNAVGATQKRPLMEESLPNKRRRLDEQLLKQKRREFTIVLKQLKKCYLPEVLAKVREICPSGIKKENGKRRLSAMGISSVYDLNQLIMFCEGFRCRDVREVALSVRRQREWQLRAALVNTKVLETTRDSIFTSAMKPSAEEEKKSDLENRDSEKAKLWRAFVVNGISTLHDLTKVLAKVFSWLPEKGFDYRPNTGKAYGVLISTNPEIQSRLVGGKLRMQEIQICEAMLCQADRLQWKYGEHTIKVELQAVSPCHDPLKRECPRLLGGEGCSPCYVSSIAQHWSSSWGVQEVLEMNRTFLEKRVQEDNLKLMKEWERSRPFALRRALPLVKDSKKGGLLYPFTRERFLFPPFSDEDVQIVHHWIFDSVIKANILDKPYGSFRTCLPVETEILVDDFRDHHLHMFHPIDGWTTLRNKKGIRLLMPRLGRRTPLPPGIEEDD